MLTMIFITESEILFPSTDKLTLLLELQYVFTVIYVTEFFKVKNT